MKTYPPPSVNISAYTVSVPQQRLAQDYASLVTDSLQRQNAVPFIDAFWQTMAREWGGVDSQRLNKYLRLMRLMLRATFQFLGKNGFERHLLEEQNNVMTRIPLNVEDASIPNGMRYHMLDVFVDELEATKDAVGDIMNAAIIEQLLKPVVSVGRSGMDKAVRNRANECLSDERLKQWEVNLMTSVQEKNGASLNDDFEGFGD
ncbi:MAG: hypothetical protein Q9159_007535 [Coniocarpon cinnabarinum]